MNRIVQTGIRLTLLGLFVGAALPANPLVYPRYSGPGTLTSLGSPPGAASGLLLDKDTDYAEAVIDQAGATQEGNASTPDSPGIRVPEPGSLSLVSLVILLGGVTLARRKRA